MNAFALALLLAAPVLALDAVPSAGPVAAAPGPELVLGTFPPHRFSGVQGKVDVIWEYVKELAGAPEGLRPPAIKFYPFDAARQDPAFTAWQAEWLARHPEVPYPFPAGFRGFHYDGTGVIQIDPATTFFNPKFYRRSYDGRMRDLVGYGYYVVAHELLHYALEQKNVPGEMHHCLYIRPRTPGEDSYIELNAKFLAHSGYGNQVGLMRWGVGEERAGDPCGETPKTFFRSPRLRRLRDIAQGGLLARGEGACGGFQRRLWFSPGADPMNWGAQINFFLQMETELPMQTVVQQNLTDPAAWPQAVGRISRPGADAAAFLGELSASGGLKVERGLRVLSEGRGIIPQNYVAVIDPEHREAIILGNGDCSRAGGAPAAR